MCLIEEIFHHNCYLSFFHEENTFRITTDSVYLSEFINIEPSDKLLVDFGCGLGVLPLLLSTRSNIKMIGFEINQSMVDLARNSIDYNRLEDQISILNIKIQDAYQVLSNKRVDIVISNPPYFKVGNHTKDDVCNSRFISRHEVAVTFEEIVKSASRILRYKGKFVIVHRIDRIVEIFEILRKYHLEPKRMSIIYDNIDKNPNLFLLEAIKGANPSLVMEKPYIIKE